MEYRFGSLGDYLTVTKGSTGIWPLCLGTSNIEHPTPNIEGGIFANARVPAGMENDASEGWDRFFPIGGGKGGKVLNSSANRKMTNGFVW